MIYNKDINRRSTTRIDTSVRFPPPSSYRGKYPFRRPGFNPNSRRPKARLEDPDNYIEHLESQQRLVQNLIIMAKNSKEDFDLYSHPFSQSKGLYNRITNYHHHNNNKNRQNDLRIKVNEDIRRKKEVLENDIRGREREKVIISPQRYYKSPSPKTKKYSRSPSTTPRKYSRSLTPRKYSKSPSKSPSISKKYSRSPSTPRKYSRSPSPQRKRRRSVSTSSRSPSRSPIRRFSVEYDDEDVNNNNVIIEEGEVPDNVIINQNWILDCNCSEEEECTKDECFYCINGSIFIEPNLK